jgi:hypothetical protein
MFAHYPARLFLLALMSLVVGMVGACAAMGGIAPETYGERLAYAKITVTGARQLGGQLLDARKISADDAQQIQNQADLARDSIKVVEGMRATDPTAADIRLQGIVAGLRGLAIYLNSKAPPGATPLSTNVKGST